MSVSGTYVDRNGRRWFCVERQDQNGKSSSVVCNSDDGHMTAAYVETFLSWRWKRETAFEKEPSP